MKKIMCIVIILTTFLAVTSCNLFVETEEQRIARENFPVELEGEYNIYSAPQRVISLSPSVTEIIFTLGSYTQLVAVSDNCDYPEQTANLPNVGTALSLEIDEILTLNPNLILTSTPIFGLTRDRLALRNIPVIVVPAANSLEELHELYENIAIVLSGNYTGRLNAENTLQNMFTEMENTTSSTNYTATILLSLDFFDNSQILNELIETAGFDLVKLSQIEEENEHPLLTANPNFIFTTEPAATKILTEERFSELSAVKNERVVVVDSELFERQGGRLVELVQTMNRATQQLLQGE